MSEFSIPQIRLYNQHLAGPQFTQPADIVKWLGAVQAQDYAGAKWAIGQRLKDSSDDLIEKAFANGDIIRTHLMRPTWHFVAPEDIRWMLDLTAKRVQAIAANRHRRLELNSNIFTQCTHVIAKIMEGGKQFARTEISAALQEAGIVTDELRFIHIMMELELRKLVCSGGREGKQFTYALLEERVPKAKILNRDESLALLTERYFTAHGPATLQDYVRWSGLTVADAKAGLEMVKHQLANVNLDGVVYWLSNSSNNHISKSDRAFLLPNYDEYIVSYKDRSSAIREKDIDKADPRGAIFNNTLILNAQIAGIWKRTLKKDSVEVDIAPFRPLSKTALITINAVVKRYARFLGVKKFTLQVLITKT